MIDRGGNLHRVRIQGECAKANMNPPHVVAEDYHIAMMRVGDHVKAANSPKPEFIARLTLSDLIHLTTLLDRLKS